MDLVAKGFLIAAKYCLYMRFRVICQMIKIVFYVFPLNNSKVARAVPSFG